jgi:threonine synthase
VGLECVIFVPASAPPAKLSQLLVFGAKVLAVAGTYDDAFDLCVKACDRYGWYCRNTGYNPYMAEGKKTVALEICEQLGFDAPDWLVVSAGDGCITDGVGKGLYDLQQLGFLAKMPRIASVQSTKSAAIYNAWKAGTEKVEPVEATTIADSISVGRPRDAIKALRAVRRSRGVMVTVEDEAILEAGRLLGRKAGVFAEPAGAAPLAGVLELMRRGDMSADDRVAVVVSGNGLKDAATASRGAGEPIGVQPDGSDLEDALKSLGVE